MTVPAGQWTLNPEPKSRLVGTVWKVRDEAAAGVAEGYREVRIVGVVDLGEIGAEIAFVPVQFGAVESADAEWFSDTYERVPDGNVLEHLDARTRALDEVAR
jgi:hypothetical protein